MWHLFEAYQVFVALILGLSSVVGFIWGLLTVVALIWGLSSIVSLIWVLLGVMALIWGLLTVVGFKFEFLIFSQNCTVVAGEVRVFCA